MLFLTRQLLFCLATVVPSFAVASDLIWPVLCPDGSEHRCLTHIGYPDIDGDGHDTNCELVSNLAHTGTDMVPSVDAVATGVAVLAAAPGKVVFTQSNMFDQCPSVHPECIPASRRKIRPNFTGGYTTCTNQGQFCKDGEPDCFWCFSGNYVVIEHADNFTAYLHLKQNSVTVAPGDLVEQGTEIGLIGSSGNSDGPHLHFELWQGGLFQPKDPWKGDCGNGDGVWVRK